MPVRAFIFDMDGVLLDSEPLHFDALNGILATEGYRVTEADNQHILGTTLQGTFQHLNSLFPLKDPLEEYYRRYDETVLKLLSGPLDPAPGVRKLLQQLQGAGIPLAVASSSRRAWVETTLRSLQVDQFFPIVVSGDDVQRGKPAPDIYLEAARRLQLAPETCLAIEDAPNGILSARRAGMKVLAVRTAYTAGLSLEEADVIVDTLEGLTPETLGIPVQTH